MLAEDTVMLASILLQCWAPFTSDFHWNPLFALAKSYLLVIYARMGNGYARGGRGYARMDRLYARLLGTYARHGAGYARKQTFIVVSSIQIPLLLTAALI